MWRNILNIKIRPLLAAVSLSFGLTSAHAADFSPANIAPISKDSAKICLAQAQGNDLCRIVKIPLPFAIDRILPGKFIDPRTVSWIAIGAKHAGVCTYDESSEVKCEVVKGYGPLERVGISVSDGRLHVTYPNPDETINSETVAKFVHDFDYAVRAAWSQLRDSVNVPSRRESISTIQLWRRGEYEDDPIDSTSDPIGWNDWPSGYDDAGAFGTRCVPGPLIVCVTGTTTSQTPPPFYDEAPPISSGSSTGGVSSSVPPPPSPLECKKVKNHCIEKCSRETLPTPKGDGWNFHICYNECMINAGCTP